MIRQVASVFLPLSLLAIMAPAIALSQDAEASLIDRELSGQWDFRDVAFSGCFEQSECFALGVVITAERRGDDGTSWIPAQLYWDPVDGIGVLGGGQNDEIDFDERVLITFEGIKEGTVNIERVWLSDIFIAEDERYGTSDPAGPEDVETAVIQSLFVGTLLAEVVVDGADVLPPDPFNEEVIAGINEGGDLLRRIIIQDGMISVLVPSTDDSDGMQLLSFPLSEVDEDKLGLFEGLDTVEVDLSDIIAGFNDVPISIGGSANAELIDQILEDLAELQSIRERALASRLVSSVSNGELGVDLDETIDVEMLIFMSAFGGSNDYSIAGIIRPTSEEQ